MSAQKTCSRVRVFLCVCVSVLLKVAFLPTVSVLRERLRVLESYDSGPAGTISSSEGAGGNLGTDRLLGVSMTYGKTGSCGSIFV